jgi:hypothetical protein
MCMFNAGPLLHTSCGLRLGVNQGKRALVGNRLSFLHLLVVGICIQDVFHFVVDGWRGRNEDRRSKIACRSLAQSFDASADQWQIGAGGRACPMSRCGDVTATDSINNR